MEEIVNRVANSALIVFDLEDYFPQEIVEFDISELLLEGILLREKDFRDKLSNYNWEQFEGKTVAIHCSTDAILPAWCFALVSSYLTSTALFVSQGSIEITLKFYYQQLIAQLDMAPYTEKAVILKGCSKKQVPAEAYVMAMQLLQRHAKSIMFGEACSAVPLYKKKNK